MNKIEKMQFLIDRMKDEKEFFVDGDNIVGYLKTSDGFWEYNKENKKCVGSINVNYMLHRELKLPSIHSFTDDEKVILRNLQFDYLVRTKGGNLYYSNDKPYKKCGDWVSDNGSRGLYAYNHLFPTIQWENEEAVDRRDYV